jgi:hypothetical protein
VNQAELSPCFKGRYHLPRTAFFHAPGRSSGISEVSIFSSGIAISAWISRFWRAVSGWSAFNSWTTVLDLDRFFIFVSVPLE